IGCLFEAHGILPPIPVPRPSVTLIEPKVNRLLERLGTDVDDLRRPFRDVAADAVAAEMPAGVRHALAALNQAIASGYAALADAAEAVDPTLRGALNGARNE